MMWNSGRIRAVAERWALLVGVGGMLLLVGGTFFEAGMRLQKYLFLVGAVALGVTAYVNGERMLTTLQIVISLGAVLAFFQHISTWVRLAVLLGPAVFGIGWLLYLDYRDQDRWWLIGGAGLVLLAVAFAISGSNPFVFNATLALGTGLVLIYSFVSFYVEGVRLQVVWVVLNAVFVLNPAVNTLSMLGVL